MNRATHPESKLVVPAESKKTRKERRLQDRFYCEALANVRLITAGITLTGKILDLSSTGCKIELERRFPVGLNVRLEILFSLHGLPVLVQGSSRCIHTPTLIGIEFSDVSPRKKEAISEIITELREKAEIARAAEQRTGTDNAAVQ